MRFAHRIALVRRYYLSVAPELEPFLALAPGTSSGSSAEQLNDVPSTWQLTLTVAGMVAAVNSVVVAVFGGFALAATGVGPLVLGVAVGVAAGATAFVVHELHHRHRLASFAIEDVDRAAIAAPARDSGP